MVRGGLGAGREIVLRGKAGSRSTRVYVSGQLIPSTEHESLGVRLRDLQAENERLRRVLIGAEAHEANGCRVAAREHPHGSLGSLRTAFEAREPSLRLCPDASVALAVAFHELATNAAEYGALAGPSGQIEVSWDILMDENGRRLDPSRIETGGLPVAVPAHQGFGSRLIRRGLAHEFGGTVRLDFASEGLRCTMDRPLPEERDGA